MLALLVSISILLSTCVNMQPHFLSENQNYVGMSGKDIVLPCRVNMTGIEQVAVIWAKLSDVKGDGDQKNILLIDRQVMTAGGDDRFESAAIPDDPTNYDLKLKNLRPFFDDGIYRCEVTSDTPLILDHRLVVHSIPVLTTVPEKSPVLVDAGVDIKLRCLATGNPKPKIHWTKDGNPLPRDVKWDARDGILKIQKPNIGHHGVYTCHAQNGVGPGVTSDLVVKIRNDFPDVSSPRKTLTVKTAEAFNVTCVYKSGDETRVEWLFNSMIIEPKHFKGVERLKFMEYSEEASSKKSVLIVNDANVHDFGNYTCRVFNRIGSRNVTIMVSGAVPDAPKISMERKGNGALALVWLVDSSEPVVEYRVDYRTYDLATAETALVQVDANDKLPIKDSTYQARFDLDNLLPETPYEFSIRAKNRYGWGPETTETVTTNKIDLSSKRLADSVLSHKQELSDTTKSAFRLHARTFALAFLPILYVVISRFSTRML